MPPAFLISAQDSLICPFSQSDSEAVVRALLPVFPFLFIYSAAKERKEKGMQTGERNTLGFSNFEVPMLLTHHLE